MKYLLTILILFASCKKEVQEVKPTCMAVTFLFKETKDTIIHWHNVCDSELLRMKSYPVETFVNPNCDFRIQVMIIGIDKCKK